MSAAGYDGNGLRESATTTPAGGSAATQQFVWDTGDHTLLMDSANAYVYGVGSSAAEQVNLANGNVTYLDPDVLGSVRGIVGVSGSLTASTSYDARGNPQTSGGLASYTPFGYAGGYTDPTGLIYLVHRYYDRPPGSSSPSTQTSTRRGNPTPIPTAIRLARRIRSGCPAFSTRLRVTACSPTKRPSSTLWHFSSP